MWKPCLPGERPVMSATTFTSSPSCVNITMPVTLLLLGWVAAALEGMTFAIAPASAALADAIRNPTQTVSAVAIVLRRRIGISFWFEVRPTSDRPGADACTSYDIDTRDGT